MATVLLLSSMMASVYALTFTSPDLALTGFVFANTSTPTGFGCTGENVSPSLVWSDAPSGTLSFAVQLWDMDAPTGGSGFYHWALLNIPPSVTSLPSGTMLPSGATAGVTDFQGTGIGSNAGYGGPCPPEGDSPHRYRFSLFALNVSDVYAAASLPPTATGALTSFVLHNRNFQIEHASFVATYGRGTTSGVGRAAGIGAAAVFVAVLSALLV